MNDVFEPERHKKQRPGRKVVEDVKGKKETGKEVTKATTDNLTSAEYEQTPQYVQELISYVTSHETLDQLDRNISQAVTEISVLRKLLHEQLLDSGRLQAALVNFRKMIMSLIKLTETEGQTGFNVKLMYDNYHDGAVIIDSNGQEVSSCYDIDKEPAEQFIEAILNLKEPGDENEKSPSPPEDNNPKRHTHWFT
jgi:hypothetical protein